MAMVIFLEKIEGKYLHVFKTNENDLATTKSVLYFVLSREALKKESLNFLIFFFIQRSLSCCFIISEINRSTAFKFYTIISIRYFSSETSNAS